MGDGGERLLARGLGVAVPLPRHGSPSSFSHCCQPSPASPAVSEPSASIWQPLEDPSPGPAAWRTGEAAPAPLSASLFCCSILGRKDLREATRGNELPARSQTRRQKTRTSCCGRTGQGRPGLLGGKRVGWFIYAAWSVHTADHFPPRTVSSKLPASLCPWAPRCAWLGQPARGAAERAVEPGAGLGQARWRGASGDELSQPRNVRNAPHRPLSTHSFPQPRGSTRQPGHGGLWEGIPHGGLQGAQGWDPPAQGADRVLPSRSQRDGCRCGVQGSAPSPQRRFSASLPPGAAAVGQDDSKSSLPASGKPGQASGVFSWGRQRSAAALGAEGPGGRGQLCPCAAKSREN